MKKPAIYKHDLGKGNILSAFSIDPNIDKEGLAKIVSSLDGKANLSLYTSAIDIIPKVYLNRLSELEIEVSDKEYLVPEPLKPYREAIGKKLDSEGKVNASVIIVDGDVQIPLRVVRGEYYDFAATRLTEQPAKLLPETYESGKTVADILKENGISLERRARYFGFAHLMKPSNGEELMMVQRVKGMGIAGDCISLSGSTPNYIFEKVGFNKPCFGIEHWWSHHFAEEMQEEFKLQWGDFWINGIHLFDDKKLTPYGVVQITTQMTSKEITQIAYSDTKVLKEHSILYSMRLEAVEIFLEKFPVFPAIYFTLKHILKE